MHRVWIGERMGGVASGEGRGIVMRERGMEEWTKGGMAILEYVETEEEGSGGKRAVNAVRASR